MSTLKLHAGQYVRIELWGKHEHIIDMISSTLNGYILTETDLTGLDDKQVTAVELESVYKHEYDMPGNPVGIELRGYRQLLRAEFLANNLPHNCLFKDTSPFNSNTYKGIIWISNQKIQMPETFVNRCEHYIKKGTKCPLYEPGCPRNVVVRH